MRGHAENTSSEMKQTWYYDVDKSEKRGNELYLDVVSVTVGRFDSVWTKIIQVSWKM